jgi:hypothetical protein
MRLWRCWKRVLRGGVFKVLKGGKGVWDVEELGWVREGAWAGLRILPQISSKI